MSIGHPWTTPGRTVLRWTFSLIQDGIKVAGVSSTNYEDGAREIAHYAMIYGQDGPVSIKARPVYSSAKPAPAKPNDTTP